MGVLAHDFVREHDADGDLGAFGVQHAHLLFFEYHQRLLQKFYLEPIKTDTDIVRIRKY